jgi:FkbM family methyltransferase
MSEQKRPPQMFRRDFLVGAAGGAAAGVGAWFLAPGSWHEARLPFGTHLTYAQCAEDRVVETLFDVLEIDAPTYLDVGAYEPIVCNNTYLFYRKGGRGVLVEPNPDLTPKLKRERPRDVVLTAGIGFDGTAEADYYVTSLPQLNTFDKEAADRVGEATAGKARVLRTIRMPLLNINDVIAEHFGAAPDYLSVDTEGFDLPILRSMDFDRFRPAIVCAEHDQGAERRAELLDLMAGHGYAVRGQTFPNTIFVDRRRMP